MFYNIIYSIISSIILTGFIYFDKNLNDDDEVIISEIFKYFLITFVINLILSILLLQFVKSDNMSMPVELNIID